MKRCGKSAPRLRQRRRHGKPHREQNRIGTATRAVRASENTAGRCQARRPGRLLEAMCKHCPRGMAVTHRWCKPAVPYRTRLTGRLMLLEMRGPAQHAGPLASFSEPPCTTLILRSRALARRLEGWRPGSMVRDASLRDAPHHEEKSPRRRAAIELQHLPLEQPAIDSARAFGERGVVALLDDSAAVEHQDPVEAAHR